MGGSLGVERPEEDVRYGEDEAVGVYGDRESETKGGRGMEVVPRGPVIVSALEVTSGSASDSESESSGGMGMGAAPMWEARV